MVQLEVDYERLLKLLNSQNRFLVQINSNDSQWIIYLFKNIKITQ